VAVASCAATAHLPASRIIHAYMCEVGDHDSERQWLEWLPAVCEQHR
jgi:hypothetical protein